MAQHSSKRARFQAATGNRLRDGVVVYFTDSGDWSADFVDAKIVDGADAAAELLAAASPSDIEQSVIEPYLFEVSEADFTPVSVREAIRTQGPSIDIDGLDIAGQS